MNCVDLLFAEMDQVFSLKKTKHLKNTVKKYWKSQGKNIVLSGKCSGVFIFLKCCNPE